MKAFITDHGDPSVGFFPITYTVECPFTKEDIDSDERVEFRQRLFQLYLDFSGGFSMTVEFEDEVEAREEELRKIHQ